MRDEMFFSSNQKALRRGKRRAARTEVCRPCLVWADDAPDFTLKGVVLDATPYGLCVRMLEQFPARTPVHVQLMRDEEFHEPLSNPLEGTVVRTFIAAEGFIDHGIQIERPEIKQVPDSRPAQQRTPKRSYRPAPAPRMYTADLPISGLGTRRRD